MIDFKRLKIRTNVRWRQRVRKYNNRKKLSLRDADGADLPANYCTRRLIEVKRKVKWAPDGVSRKPARNPGLQRHFTVKVS